jgi:prepilin-type N-terminal cleavage/methylation domain-containing protein
MRGAERGFTLIEVVFAMLLFLLVSTAITALAVGSMAQTVRNRYGTAAVMLAQQEVERLHNLAYDDVEAATAVSEVDGIVYAVDTAVAEDVPAAGMKQITTTVTWNLKGLTGSYAVETILTSFAS